MQGLVFVGTGTATVAVVEKFPLAVEAEPVRNVTVSADEEDDLVVALPTIVLVPDRAVVASVMVDENVWYVPVAVAALAGLVPVKMVRAGSLVDIEGADCWLWTALIRDTATSSVPRRLRDAILRKQSTAHGDQKKKKALG